MSNFEEKRETRNRFLRAACDLGENRTLRMVSLENIGAQLSMDASNSTAEDELIDIASYLEDRGLIEGQADGYGLLSITSKGIDEVEGNSLPREFSTCT